MEWIPITDQIKMNNKSNSTAPKIYKQICKQLNRPINYEVKAGLSDAEFFLKVDLVCKSDLEPIIQLVKQYNFRSMILQGGCESIQNKKLNRSTLHVPNSKLFSVTSDFLQLLKVFSKMITTSLELISFGIRDVRLSNEAITILSQGIAASQSLKELDLRGCSLSTQSLTPLSSSIRINSSLIALDLSRNFLTDGSGIIIQGILEEHGQRRDNLEWDYKSRGESPEEDIALRGICEINLSFNRLDTNFVKDLQVFLGSDRWVRSLNLRGNIIDENGLLMLNELLDVNKTLCSLDVRDNPGAKSRVSKSIYSKLVRNMNNLKEQNSLLANVSAIPLQVSVSSASYQNDQESPMISFGDRILEQNITKQNSQSSKKEIIKEEDVAIQNQQCSQCCKYIQQLQTAQKVIALLKQENRMLRGTNRNPETAQRQHYSFQHSTSNVLNNIWQTENQQNQNQGEQEDMINRIEQMMSELTHMMDSLEHQNSATNHNLTAHLSSTIIGPNNNTHLIYPRDHMIVEPQFMNILDGNNFNLQPQPQNDDTSFE